MLDELKEEEIVKKCGGRFKLSTLIQKRMVALNRGARPLVDIQTKNPMDPMRILLVILTAVRLLTISRAQTPHLERKHLRILMVHNRSKSRISVQQI